MRELFRFKKFSVVQNRSAMKVGTDGVLLGAWASLERNPDSILDIGSGTGLIALMLAQRSDTETIDAIEIDEDAYEECVENFENSDWGNRLFCYHAGLNEFVEEWKDSYHLIVSNPPFYSENVMSSTVSRDSARQNQFLPFEELIAGVSKILSPDGLFSTVIPYKEEDRLLEIALQFKLYPRRMTRVRGNTTSVIKRSLLEFGRERTDVSSNELTIEFERHVYTPEYIALTQDFYLKM